MRRQRLILLGLVALGALAVISGCQPAKKAPPAPPVTETPAPDTTAPVVTLEIPAHGSSTNNATPGLSGAAGTASGDIATVVVTIFESDGVTVNQMPTATVTTNTWSATATTLTDGTYVAQATQSDDAGNTGTSTANTFTVDMTSPDVTVDQAGSQADPTNDPVVHFTVTFTEDVTGFDAADVALAGTATATVTDVTGGPAVYDVEATATTDGTVVATVPAGGAVDAANNPNTVSTSTDNSVNVDTTAPAPSNVTLANGPGTAGRVAQGDTVTVVYSERLSVNSMCSAWPTTGDASAQTQGALSNADVTVAISATDILTVTSTNCTFNFGSIALNGDYVTANATFGLTATANTGSIISWNGTNTLTITLGALKTGTARTTGQPTANAVPVYTPDAAIKDSAGNGINTTPFNGTSSRF